MASGVPAGRLSIEIVAEIARLQQDLDKAKRLVNAASGDIARGAKAVNDNIGMVTRSAGQQRQAMQQLGFQLNDVATMWASGAKPAQIFGSQIGQLAQVAMLAGGSLGKFGAFLSGPWGMALTIGAIALTPLIGKLFESEEAAEAAEKAMKRLATAMENLANLDFNGADLTAGTNRLIQLRGEIAQLERDIANPARQFTRGQNRETLAAKRAEEAEVLARLQFATDPNNPARLIRDRNRAFLDAANDRDRPDRVRGGREGPTAAEIAQRYEDQLLSISMQSLAAMQQVTTNTEDRAELEMRALEWNSRQLKQQIEADEHFNAAQKAELTAAADRLAGYQREALEFRKRQELEQQARQIADAQYQAAADALAIELSMADTAQDRKDIALQIFDAEQAYLRAKLEAVAASEVVSDTERKLAEIQLQALNATQSQRRQGVANANMTPWERYLSDIHRTEGEMNEALMQVRLNGLQSLEDGLIDVMVNFRSLGDVARQVIRQIAADLMRLAIQKAIFAAVGGALGGGSAPHSLGGSLLSGIAGNAFGTNYWRGGPTWVGEHGPEVVNIPRGSQIVPAHQSANDNRAGPVHFHFPGVTNAREAREAGQQAARSFRKALNGPVRA